MNKTKLVKLQIEKRKLKYDLNKLEERMKEVDEQISKLEPRTIWSFKSF